ARRLQVAALGRRLADERRRRAGRRAGDRLAAARAADLLVLRQEDAERALAARAPERLEQHDEAALHVVGARPVRTPVLEPPRQRGDRASRPDGVEVAEQEERRPRPGEVGAHTLAFERDVAAEAAQLLRRPVADRRRVAGRRLELDELAQELDHGRLTARILATPAARG